MQSPSDTGSRRRRGKGGNAWRTWKTLDATSIVCRARSSHVESLSNLLSLCHIRVFLSELKVFGSVDDPESVAFLTREGSSGKCKKERSNPSALEG